MLTLVEYEKKAYNGNDLQVHWFQQIYDIHRNKNKMKESHMTTLITCNDNVIIEVNF